MTGPCNETTLPHFEVHADNENRFNRPTISYLKAVHVYVRMVKISILKGGTVQVNGTNVNLAVSPAPGVSVFKSGKFYTVSMDFGVTVRYDGNHFMDIKVIKDYEDKLCGLCGDYDGNAKDDFRKPDGSLTNNPNDFGHSWNTDPECNKKPNTTIPDCEVGEQEMYESSGYCGILLDKKGPFAVCHRKVNPNNYFRDCVFDLCELDGAKPILCEAIEAYVNECQDRGVNIGPWRNETFCRECRRAFMPFLSLNSASFPPPLALSCQPNSHYEPCADPCQETCLGKPSSCGGPCSEGCSGDEFYVEDCQLKCRCNAPFMTCSAFDCPPMHECKLQEGELGCYPTGSPGTTTPKPTTPGPTTPKPTTPKPTTPEPKIIFGDGCSKLCRCAGNYTLECVENSCEPTEECREVNGVSGCYPKGTSTCIASGDPHYTTFDKRKYNFMGNCSYLMTGPCNETTLPHFEVHADNENRFNRPTISYLKAVHVYVRMVKISILKGGTVQVNGTNVNLAVSPAPGVSVFKSGKFYTVSMDFGVTVRYDGNHFMDIKVIKDYEDKLCGLCGDYDGNAKDDFRKPDGSLTNNPNDFGHSWNTDPECNKKPNTTIPDCEVGEQEMYESSGYCGILLDKKGPFAVCHRKVNPNNYFRDCVFDLCELDGAKPILCEAIEAYVNECQDRGVNIGPGGTKPSAVSVGVGAFMPFLSLNSASFPPPLALSCQPNSHYEPCADPCQETCLGKPSSCGGPCSEGCSGDEFYVEDCQLKCRCNAPFMTCSTFDCPPMHECKLQEGELGCYPTGSQDCVVSGDPHYNTFDKKFYTFMGTCTYTLARTCKNNTVEAKNEERGVSGASYLRKLYVTVNGVTVTLMKSRRTLVNGLRVALPNSPSPLITISLAGQYITLKTPFGLRVRWDGNHYAQISVPSSYYDQMCGLCGDYDGKPDNDFTKPDGVLVGNVNDFGNSWQTKEDEDDTCTPGTKPDPDCDPKLEAEVVKPEKCGKIKDPAGPFRECISKVDPTPFFQSCVYDMCRFNGQQHVLCDQLQAYTDVCQSAGAKTCLGVGGSPGCQDVCVEGCECNPGYILSNDKCVSLKDCGCVDPSGNYHPVNDNWYLEGCEQKCVCHSGGSIQCQNTSCKPSTESCQLHEGEYDCRPLGSGICSVSGDPHYTTFDKRTHNYMGACSYTLSKPCNESSGMPYFSVDTQNEHRGSSKKISYVRAVVINVNGTAVVPPVSTIRGVKIYLSGKFVVLETDFGLRVRFDGNHHADVTLPTSYNGLLCGMCGNFNGDSKDDNLKPDNKPAANTNELGDSWLVPDPRPDCTNGGEQEDCDDKVEAEAQKPTSCGMITDPNGIFKPCHSVVPPGPYFENCVYDMCGTGGQTVALCQAIESYADMCASAGVPIAWRNNTFCPLKCPPGSQYNPCGPACSQPSCQDPASPGSCNYPCVEGCVCNPGLEKECVTWLETLTTTPLMVCDTTRVTPFKIVAKNEERGQPEASYVRSVKVYLPFDNVVELQKSRRVTLNGRRVRTPLSIDTVGTKVKFDGVHHLQITVPGEYYNKLCGMCGNYNHNSTDDNLMPNKKPAKDPDTRPDIHPNCTTEEETLYEAQCGNVILSDRFQPCHSLVPPEAFLGNCIYDMCEYNGMQATLCDNVEAYAAACQSAGVTISWRNNTFCHCTAPCPPTCSDLFPMSCHLPPTSCVEGCQCDAGYVLSDTKCVPLDKCGCLGSDGEYHDVGDSWLTEKCTDMCTCDLGGKITCKAQTCNSNSVCALDKYGDVYCKPTKFNKCSISGDPHFRTFDGFTHHFQGPYTYVLAQGHNLQNSMAPLVVRGKNIRRGGNRRVSFLDQMYIDVYGINVRFLQRKTVLVNGERVAPPLSPVDGLTITMNSRQVQLTTDFGLTVRFDGNIRGEIIMPNTYKNSVRGLCGNYDGITRNEYMKPDGSVVRDLNNFGESWRVSDRQAEGVKISTFLRQSTSTGFETSDCSKAQLDNYNSAAQCGALSDSKGPFAVCHAALPPKSYQDDCVFDLCAEEGSAALRCASYEAYVAACQEAGVKLGSWRQQLGCALSCDANSSYTTCMSPCPASCADLAAPSECDTTSCVEGCQCAAGFVMSEGICVPYTQCGCTFLNRYYTLGEKFVTEDCSETCECTSTGAVCQAKTCQGGYLCTIFDFKRDCYRASPCLDYPCLNGGVCKEASNSTYTCLCVDGFQGTNCEVEITETGGGLETKWIILIAVLASVAVIAIVTAIEKQEQGEKTKPDINKDLRGRSYNFIDPMTFCLSTPCNQHFGQQHPSITFSTPRLCSSVHHPSSSCLLQSQLTECPTLMEMRPFSGGRYRPLPIGGPTGGVMVRRSITLPDLHNRERHRGRDIIHVLHHMSALGPPGWMMRESEAPPGGGHRGCELQLQLHVLAQLQRGGEDGRALEYHC
ncbi:hypothetical protein F7725_004155 [Dissostichus mawsoni]|uniref:Zonadhesin n=1 Tax=Dissostichus mawsoni TaxID=36200 RepID=A0A7J5XID6_DISMA|nr:hypothetical protein F7725_004155 [Dissostichus mawsoni]